MLTDPVEAITIMARSQDDEPEDIWARLGVDVQVPVILGYRSGQHLGVDPRIVLMLMEQGALLAEAGMEVRT